MAAATPSSNLAPSSTPAPTQAAPVIESMPDQVVVRTAAVSMVLPYAVWNGRLQNPDTVLRQFGGSYGTAFYRLMLQQNLSLSADCSQWEDRVNAIDRRIKSGKPGDAFSDQAAKDVRSIFKRINGTNIINLWILRSRWYGFSAIGKAGWKKDPETGVIAPFDLYNIDPWRWKFGPNMEPYLLIQGSAWNGVRVDQSGQPWERSVFFARWGSLFTAYGESDLRDIYLSCWYVQNVTEMLLQSIEVLGRPIPWIEVGDSLQGQEFDDFEANISKQYKYYVITRTPNARTTTTFPNLTVLANGAAGKSELEFVRYHDGLIQRKIHGTQQTQDKTGGSRALEDSRIGIAYDKTPPGSQLLDQTWTSGWLNDIGLVNWPNQPRELWPVMDSEAGEIGKLPHSGPQIMAIGMVGNQLRLKQLTPTWAVEMLVMVDFDRSKAEDMVNSMTDEAANLSTAPPASPSTGMGGFGTVSIPTDAGQVLNIASGSELLTLNRGWIKAGDYQRGDVIAAAMEN